MIPVDRPEDPPEISIYTTKRSKLPDGTKVTAYEKERFLAIEYYANPDNYLNDEKLTQQKAPKFSVYKNTELAEKLAETFNDKCAYCESKFGAVTKACLLYTSPSPRDRG